MHIKNVFFIFLTNLHDLHFLGEWMWTSLAFFKFSRVFLAFKRPIRTSKPTQSFVISDVTPRNCALAEALAELFWTKSDFEVCFRTFFFAFTKAARALLSGSSKKWVGNWNSEIQYESSFFQNLKTSLTKFHIFFNWRLRWRVWFLVSSACL